MGNYCRAEQLLPGTGGWGIWAGPCKQSLSMLNKVHAGRWKLRLSNHENTEKKTDVKGISLLLLGLPSWAQKCLHWRALQPKEMKLNELTQHCTATKITCKPEWFPNMAKASWLGYDVAPNLVKKQKWSPNLSQRERYFVGFRNSYRVFSDWGYHCDCTAVEHRSEKMRVWLWKSRQRSRRSSWSLSANTSKSEVGAEWTINREGKVPDRN